MDKVTQLELGKKKEAGKSGQKKAGASRSKVRPKPSAEDIKVLFNSSVQLGDCPPDLFSAGFRLFLADTEDPERLKKSLASLGERLKKVQDALSILVTIT